MNAEARVAFLEENAANVPVQHASQTEDIADAVLFVAGNGFVTIRGQEASGFQPWGI
jgi:hypothetical protein